MVLGPGARSRVIWALRRAGQAVDTEKEQRLRPSGLTGAQFAVLAHVAHRPGITGAELARALGVTPQNVTTLAARLQERGMLERRAHPSLAHVLELYLTADGRAALACADHALAMVDAEVAAMLGPDDVATLRGLLERVAAGLGGRPAL